ncbi:hypothetical protein [Bordetella trematum]|uniref:hypothetical protein n=1 Tax=Bordetella trematum TaxID=123899 RepID=UPI000D80EF91|nr:hypothetical protein [Bordetella trematum]SPU49851.1 Uncharacterised protein [Bordetella trematum]VDH07596.1 Uncharacterised protein [Bordetella trematum]
MTFERRQEFRKLIHDVREKHVHFLLAAAGACIAFAVTQTRGERLSVVHLPLGIALLSWAVSFWLGCIYLRHRSTTFAINERAITVEDGDDPNVGSDPVLKQVGLKALQDNFTKFDKTAGLGYTWQLRCFVIGAAFFLAWHVLDMLNTPAKPFWT